MDYGKLYVGSMAAGGAIGSISGYASNNQRQSGRTDWSGFWAGNAAGGAVGGLGAMGIAAATKNGRSFLKAGGGAHLAIGSLIGGAAGGAMGSDGWGSWGGAIGGSIAGAVGAAGLKLGAGRASKAISRFTRSLRK